MSVLNRDDYFARLESRLAGDASDEAISFLEDMTDTYNDLETRANGDGVDWEQRYKDNDAMWKARYQNRFFNGGDRAKPVSGCASSESEEDAYNPDEVTVDTLFEIKED